MGTRTGTEEETEKRQLAEVEHQNKPYSRTSGTPPRV
jgi:hypothetical protein